MLSYEEALQLILNEVPLMPTAKLNLHELRGHVLAESVITPTDLPAFGTKHFSIPFDATGRAWVRFAVWDSAGNGAFVQSRWIK